MPQCKEEKYGPCGEYPAQCQLEEGHSGLHRVVDELNEDCVFLWPIQKSPTPLDVVASEFAAFMEGSIELEKWPESRMERLASAFEQIDRAFAAENLRKHWAIRNVAQKRS